MNQKAWVVFFAWWILVNPTSWYGQRIPQALGPYPSKELCRIAGKSVMPDDEQFWTELERHDAKIRREQNERDIQVAIHAKWLQTHKAGEVGMGGSVYKFDKDGNRLQGWIVNLTSYPEALTGCMEDK